MSNQIVISSGAKVRNLDGVLTGTSGIVNSVPLGAANGVATLDSGGKVPVSQLPSSVVTYLGTWNAATNTPTLVNGTGDAGDMYICNVAGTVNFGAGPVTFAVGDWVLYGSGTWQKSNGQNGTVTSVGVSRDGDALTITASPITTSGTINIGFAGTSGQYINGAGGLTTFPSLTGYVPYTGATSDVDLGTYALNAGPITSEFGVAFKILAAGILYQNGYSTISTLEGTVSIGQAISSGNTKSFTFDFSSWDNNTSRTYTLPDLSGTLALLEGTQTFTGGKTFSFAPRNDGGILLKNNVTTGSNGYVSVGSNSTGLTIGVYNSGTTYYHELLMPNSASYDYTFPAASGTLALTSNLSSYVPYTGATADVNLGSNALLSSTLSVLGAGTTAGYLSFTPNTNNAYSAWTSIAAYGDSALSFSFNPSAGQKLFNFDVSGLTVSTMRTYTMPNASGTIALTSDLSAYVTLGTYQTITANKSFSGWIKADNALFLSNSVAVASSTGYGTITYNKSGTVSTFRITNENNATASLVFDNTTNYDYTFPDVSGTVALTSDIPSLTGYVPYTGATANLNLGTFDLTADVITGATGSFASSGGSDTFTINHSSGSGVALTITKGGNGEGLIINKTSGSGNALSVTGSTSLGALSGTSATFSGQVVITNNNSLTLAGFGLNSFNLSVDTVGGISGLHIGVSSPFLSISESTGGATFASSVGVGLSPFTNTLSSGNIDLAQGAGLFGYANQSYLTNNAYYDGGFKYKANAAASLYLQTSAGDHVWFTAASGTAGGAITNNERMRITSGGNVGIGTSSPTYKLVVSNSGAEGFEFIPAFGTNINVLQNYNRATSTWGTLDVRANDYVFRNQGTAAMTITSGGNVGIGTNSPVYKLQLVNSGNTLIQLNGNNTTGALDTGFTISADDTKNIYLYQRENAATVFGTNNTERMRITSDGLMLLGATSSYTSYGLIQITGDNKGIAIRDSDGFYRAIYNQSGTLYFYNGSNEGYLNTAGAWVNASDVSIKKDVKDLEYGLKEVLKLKPKSYKMIDNDLAQIGFIAQEVGEILPELVDESKKGMKGLSYGQMTAVLVKAIQEQQAQIELLSNKIVALESK
jgi:hypothetical protein